MTRGAAAPRKEQVYFSSRSHHMKVKKPKEPEPDLIAQHSDKASETSSKRRISTVASLKAVRNMALPNSKAHIPSAERERSGSNGSSTLWGSLSTVGGNSVAVNPYAGHRDSNTEVAISSTISSTRPSSDLASGSHYSDMTHRPENRRSTESRLSSLSARSSGSNESGASAQSALSEARESKFWDDVRISHTVTEAFIEESIKRIPGNEQLVLKLKEPVAFGDGLTETTYVEWIVSRAQKFFLILVDIGIPEQIFGITDDSWADDDLPVSLDAIPRLKLSPTPDPALDRKFFKVQYTYLLRFLYQGAHIDFEEFETVPLEVVNNCHGLFSQPVDHVRCPRNPDVVFTRKKFFLYDRDGNCWLDEFMDEINSFKAISHRHIVELYASYTYKGFGYLLLSPATNFTLRSFLHHPPPEFSKLTEDTRRFKLLDWMRCLSDALAYLYDQEIPHGDIRPRSVVIDGKTGEIYFSDVGSQRRLAFTRFATSENERYEYSAPELFQRVAQFNISQSPTNLQFDGGRTGRKNTNPIHREPLEGRNLSIIVPPTGADGIESPRRLSLAAADGGSVRRSSVVSGPSSPIAEESPHSPKGRTFSTSAKGVSAGAVRVAEWICRPAAKSDVFSLGCIMLDMLTFHSHKKKLSNFSSARARHHRAAGSRGGGQPDSSFHATLPETNEWIKDLKTEAVRRDDDAVAAVLILVSRMLSKDPEDRPTPREVGDKLLSIMSFVKKPHCEQFVEWTTDTGSFSNWSGWDDPHEYGSPTEERNADRDSMDPHDAHGVHHQLSRLSFHTFGHGSSSNSSHRPRHTRNGSLESPVGSNPSSAWANSSGSSLTPSMIGVPTSTYC
ncbi:hypothetical protein ABW19_dt0206565 [Dactylella cylindrospora]|nr:hypothetical protein ABW19_dt0206565 [Dactylella cylindrospora]